MKTIEVTVPDNYEWSEKEFKFNIKEKKEFEYQHIEDLEIGDVVLTNLNEEAKLVSKYGNPNCPYIFLITRYDNGYNDTFAVDSSGRGWGYNEKYYIKNTKLTNGTTC